MTRDSYFLYALSLAFSFFVFEFAITFIKSVFRKQVKMTANICVILVQIAEVLYALISIVLCEYIYVNRSAGISSFLLGALIFLTVRGVMNSKIVAMLIAFIFRPVSRFINFLATWKLKKPKCN